MNQTLQAERVQLMQRFAASIRAWLQEKAAQDAKSRRDFLRFDPNDPHRFLAEPGLRVAVVALNMGLGNARLLKELDEPTLAQIIPWETAYKPVVNLDGRRVKIEAPLPDHLQITQVELSELGMGRPTNGFLLGPNQQGVITTLCLSEVYHILVAGETRSGKSSTMRSIGAQISEDQEVSFALLDGKEGEGLGILNGLPGQIGPLAINSTDVLNALGWAIAEMDRRYAMIREDRGGQWWQPRDPEAPPHVVIFFDEFQRFRDSETIMRAFHLLASQGAAARIHIIAGTQYPTVGMFGDDAGGIIRDQFGTRIGHSVVSYRASEAAMGGNWPRLDYLLGRGDTYVKASVDGRPVLERIQMAYLDPATVAAKKGAQPRFRNWPQFNRARLENRDDDEETRGRKPEPVTDAQFAAAVYAAQLGHGRRRLQNLLDQIGEPIGGSSRVDNLLQRAGDFIGLMEAARILDEERARN